MDYQLELDSNKAMRREQERDYLKLLYLNNIARVQLKVFSPISKNRMDCQKFHGT